MVMPNNLVQAFVGSFLVKFSAEHAFLFLSSGYTSRSYRPEMPYHPHLNLHARPKFSLYSLVGVF